MRHSFECRVLSASEQDDSTAVYIYFIYFLAAEDSEDELAAVQHVVAGVNGLDTSVRFPSVESPPRHGLRRTFTTLERLFRPVDIRYVRLL